MTLRPVRNRLTIFEGIPYNSQRAYGYTDLRYPPRGGGMNWSKAVFGSIACSAITLSSS